MKLGEENLVIRLQKKCILRRYVPVFLFLCPYFSCYKGIEICLVLAAAWLSWWWW